MSWGNILFGFRARIGRKTFWLGILAITAINFGFLALVSYWVWGDAFPLRHWGVEKNSEISVLAMSAEFIFAWPWTALAIKRLQDCASSHPALAPAWRIYTIGCIYINAWVWLYSWTKLLIVGDWDIMNIVFIIFAGTFLVLRLGVLRSIPDPNAHTEDTLRSH